LSRRGREVTAIARNPDTIAKLPGVTVKKGDVFDKPGLVQRLKGHDAVISAVHFTASDPKLLIDAVEEAGVTSAVIAPGERTGKFRLGKDQLLTHDKGSNISWEDYSIAAVDELEKPAHIRERFTAGY
jgi:putative NADH-flavin reductase